MVRSQIPKKCFQSSTYNGRVNEETLKLKSLNKTKMSILESMSSFVSDDYLFNNLFFFLSIVCIHHGCTKRKEKNQLKAGLVNVHNEPASSKLVQLFWPVT
jgi:hypothetical protein